jgi:hypothetical protein
LFLSAIAGLAGIATLKIGVRGSVPDESYAVNVVDNIACNDEVVFRDVPRMMCYQAREIVLMDLVRERVLGRYDHVFQKARLRGRDVCEPTSSLSVMHNSDSKQTDRTAYRHILTPEIAFLRVKAQDFRLIEGR